MGAPQYEQAGADIGGTGTTNTIPRWTGPSTLGDSAIAQTGTNAIGFGTPKTWGTNFTTNAIQLSESSSLAADVNTTYLAANQYWNSPGFQNLRIKANFAARYLLNGATGDHQFQIAPFGAADSTITWTTAMTILNTSGNVGFGTASPQVRAHVYAANVAGKGQIMVDSPAGDISQITFYNAGTTANGALYANTSGMVLGTSSSGSLSFQQNGGTAWQIIAGRHLVAGADNSYDIGASGATRPRTVYVGTSVIVGPSATAAGTNANAIGQSCSASGANSAAIGQGCTAAGQNSSVLGGSSRADGFGSCVVGYAAQTSANASFALASGFQSIANLYGAHSHGSGNFASLGDAQKTLLVARVQTTNATATNLWLNGTSTRLAMPNSTAWAADVHIVARSATGAGHAYFVRRVLIKRDANAASTALVGTVQTIGTDIGSNAGLPPVGWAVAVTADTTNGALDLQVTGALATTINWVARVELVEVSLA